MSRIGKQAIKIPDGIKVELNTNLLTVTGKKDALNYTLPENITVVVSSDELVVQRSNDDPNVRALHGLSRSLINNMVVGCDKGFEKRLELIGTGYRVQQKGKSLEMNVGFSHPIIIDPLENNDLKVDGQNLIIISGPDKQSVGQQAAIIRKFRPPNPYTGKGIKYSDEVIRRKAGKTAVGGTQ
ncbi:MAG: 50S ribosomal protein L6 [Chloroflexi bacterium]|nr:50S ribosomal protein L6 [Chloroflexota bacterium]|tara:strand:- start:483 stop:1031 length:549 start_codon:yes stop_codon:yes gene_type:complete